MIEEDRSHTGAARGAYEQRSSRLASRTWSFRPPRSASSTGARDACSIAATTSTISSSTHSFEEVVYLLWHGALPTRKELEAHVKALSATATRRLPPKLVGMLRQLPRKTPPMEVLRTGVSALSAFDPDAGDNSREASLRKALRLTAQMPTLVAAWERIRRGRPLVAPNPRQGLAANFLTMLTGKARARWPPRRSTWRSSSTRITSSTPPRSPPASPRPPCRTCTRPSPPPSGPSRARSTAGPTSK